eukprot:RCo013896
MPCSFPFTPQPMKGGIGARESECAGGGSSLSSLPFLQAFNTFDRKEAHRTKNVLTEQRDKYICGLSYPRQTSQPPRRGTASPPFPYCVETNGGASMVVGGTREEAEDEGVWASVTGWTPGAVGARVMEPDELECRRLPDEWVGVPMPRVGVPRMVGVPGAEPSRPPGRS